MKKILYISSLSHSGSTLLDLALGGHSRMVGLGEVALVLKKNKIREDQFSNVFCSCGQLMNECLFWGKTIAKLRTADNLGFADRYIMVLEAFDEVFGPDTILVDSSKYKPYLEPIVSEIAPKINIDIKIVNLIKDVRNYTISQIDTCLRNGSNNKKRRIFRNNSFYYFWEWILLNKKMHKYFQIRDLNVLKFGYEEFCFYPDYILPKLCEFAGVKPETDMLDLKASNSHSVLGNRMRTQSEKKKIQYDYRWFTRREWQLPAMLFRNIMAYNKEHVYGNNLDAIWKR